MKKPISRLGPRHRRLVGEGSDRVCKKHQAAPRARVAREFPGSGQVSQFCRAMRTTQLRVSLPLGSFLAFDLSRYPSIIASPPPLQLSTRPLKKRMRCVCLLSWLRILHRRAVKTMPISTRSTATAITAAMAVAATGEVMGTANAVGHAQVAGCRALNTYPNQRKMSLRRLAALPRRQKTRSWRQVQTYLILVVQLEAQSSVPCHTPLKSPWAHHRAERTPSSPLRSIRRVLDHHWAMTPLTASFDKP